MRQELAVVFSPIIALIATGPIVLLGDGRAQYGFAIIIAALLPLFFSLLMVPVHLALVKFTNATLVAYSISGILLGILGAALCLAGGGGAIASTFSFFWPSTSFIVFKLLLGFRHGWNRAIT
ncbi:hypothetical protein PVT67_05260 [Gallaecimonas kandeliae]|uniref:hypothetical protein n=1 Tax=Gallaecimonas kandeliae TaxID=3029055 RepID=UPI002648683D|nr:hypothetical protein [Gallaecimonas kandeliae]WKE66654.1 hypothetical protein PVT67_05260 [Gallaecimonas kandeliae]